MENAKVDAFKKKLEGICDENNLVFRFRYDTYPITLTISPVSGMDAQITMLEMADVQPYNSPDAKLVFSVEDGALTYKMSERFTIGDVLFNKIKNLFKNIHYMYLQMFHRECIEKSLLRAGYFPEVNDCDTPQPEGLDEETVDIDELEESDLPDAPEVEDYQEENSDDVSLLQAATKFCRERNEISSNDLMKKFSLSFAAAARLLDALEEAEVLGGYSDSGKRIVLAESEGENG